MSFFQSLGHFFKHGASAFFKFEPLVVATAEAAGAGHFLAKPLEAQALITSIVGDVIDARRAAGQGGVAAGIADALKLEPAVVQKIDQLIALVKAHPEAPKN